MAVTRCIDFVTQTAGPGLCGCGIMCCLIKYIDFWVSFCTNIKALSGTFFDAKPIYPHTKSESVTFTWQWEKGCHKNLNAQEECFCLSWSLWNNAAQEKLLGPTSTATHLLKNQQDTFLSLFCQIQVRETLTSRSITQTFRNHGLRRAFQPQTVGIAVTEGHRQGAVHRQRSGEKQRHR